MSRTKRYYKLAVFLLMSGLVTTGVGSNLAQGKTPLGDGPAAASERQDGAALNASIGP